MGTCGNLFQASSRSAMMEKRRGEPSSGSALREATRTKPPPALLRRRGSRKAHKPARNGTSEATPPATSAAAALRKPRRCWRGLEAEASFIVDQSWLCAQDAARPGRVEWGDDWKLRRETQSVFARTGS